MTCEWILGDLPAVRIARVQALAGKELIIGSAFMHGWVSLPSRGEIYLEHGVPRHVRIDDKITADVERLVDEIIDVTGLHVTLDRWLPAEEAGEIVAAVHVSVQDISEVLKRLARASAETFFDRYHKPIDASDTDFDDEACAQDVNTALQVCGLQWAQFHLDQPALRGSYRQALHQAAAEIAEQQNLN